MQTSSAKLIVHHTWRRLRADTAGSGCHHTHCHVCTQSNTASNNVSRILGAQPTWLFMPRHCVSEQQQQQKARTLGGAASSAALLPAMSTRPCICRRSKRCRRRRRGSARGSATAAARDCRPWLSVDCAMPRAHLNALKTRYTHNVALSTPPLPSVHRLQECVLAGKNQHKVKRNTNTRRYIHYQNVLSPPQFNISSTSLRHFESPESSERKIRFSSSLAESQTRCTDAEARQRPRTAGLQGERSRRVSAVVEALDVSANRTPVTACVGACPQVRAAPVPFCGRPRTRASLHL